jgi:PBSX family phage terminase large subunit
VLSPTASTTTRKSGSATSSTRSKLRAHPKERTALRSELGPRFANPQQKQFLQSRHPELLYSGAFRAGKSRIGCEKGYDLAKRYPGIPIGIFRKVASSLPASTERTLLLDVLPRGAIARSNKTEHWYELANGSRFWLLGLDPDPITKVPSKVGSVELGWAFIDEAVEVTEADWTMVKGRLSWPGIPYHQIAAGTNPAHPEHWLIKRFQEDSDRRLLLHARTLDNTMLPQDYRDEMAAMPPGLMRSRYVEGLWAGDIEGALWKSGDIRYEIEPRILRHGELEPDLMRVVVAIDPAVTSNPGSDETGILVVGLAADGKAYVLDDRSARIPADKWAERAVQTYHQYKADVIVAEVNNGGDLVELVIRNQDPNVAYASVHASRGKFTRAEPVAQLYVKDRVRHVRSFPELEAQLCSWNPLTGEKSPDRLDALVWAITHLMLGQGVAGDFSLVA